MPTIAAAQDRKPPQIVGVRVGIADRYKAGLWTQVEVTVLGGSDSLTGELAVIVPDGDGVPGRATKPCQVLPGRATTVRFITRFGRVDSDLDVEFCIDNRAIAHRLFETAIQPDAEHFLPALDAQRLIVTVGLSSVGVEDAGKLGGLEADSQPVSARIDDIEQLPTHWCGYEGIDTVILSTSRPDIYRKLAANNARVQALDQWVRMGGRLVFCVGSQADEILAENSPLRQFAPGRLDKMVTLHQTGSIETYCSSRSSISSAVGGKVSMRVPRLVDVQGVCDISEDDLPVVVRTARGFGQVIFVAADLDQSPLSKWTDRSVFVAKLLDMPTSRVDKSKENAAMMHHGYNDLSGQLRSALDRFTGVRLIPFWIVAGLIVAYILLIGPGDYFFLRKIVRRMEWTWVTFPLIVVLVSVAAYFLAYRLKGDQLRTNEIDLVDVDAASGQMRGTTWLNVFSPRMESFNFAIKPCQADGQALPNAREWTAWLGLPGSGLGGMNPRANGPLLWAEQFRYAPDFDALYGVPIQVWSTKSLTARWEAPNAACPDAELIEADQTLSGSITNTLTFPLRNCILAYGASVYQLDDLKPGESARLGTTAKRSALKTFLTGHRAVFTEGTKPGDLGKTRDEVTPYDQSSTELAYILRMMMFYEAAGGHYYTGMWNSYQEFVDLSGLLKAGRAILIAQKPIDAGNGQKGAELLRDGRPLAGQQDQHQTMYRFVFPVKKER